MQTVQHSPQLREGIQAARRGYRDRAYRLIQEAAAHEPNNDAAWLWLAGVTRNPFEALNCLERVLQINPHHEHARAGLKAVLLQAGIKACKEGDDAQGRQLLRRATTESPHNETAWLWLARASDKPEEAIYCFERALAINPNNERARKGIEYYRSKLKKAPEWQCPLCQGSSTQEEIQCPRCGVILDYGDINQILNNPRVDPIKVKADIDRLVESIQQEPSADKHFCLGMAHLNIQEVHSAIEHFKAALELRPSDRKLRIWVTNLSQRASAMPPDQLVKHRHDRAVLLVSGSAEVLQPLSTALEKAEFAAIATADGYDAIAKLRRCTPAVIVLDENVPGMTALELCKLIKRTSDLRHVPVLMLTTDKSLVGAVRRRLAGCVATISKPVDGDHLIKLVSKYVRCEPSSSIQFSKT